MDKEEKAALYTRLMLAARDEIDTLNRLTVIFLETAELRVKERKDLTLQYWRENVDKVLAFNDKAVLSNTGRISHEQMEARTGELYIRFDQDRKQREAIEADLQDEADLKALEAKIQRRPKA